MPSLGEYTEIGWSHVPRGHAQNRRGLMGRKMSGAVFREDSQPQ